MAAQKGSPASVGTDRKLRVQKAVGDPAGSFSYRLSSGLFGLPAIAKSVGWMVVNDSPTPQVVRVSVFRGGVGLKTLVAPGIVSVTVAVNATTHNANGVGFDKPFVPGFFYEVILETNDRRVLPSVHIWQDSSNTVIPGTLISPGTFVRI